jgi:adenosylcobinamide-phosphate synthase
VILVGALLLDLGIGEPSNFCHPVAWLGAALGRAFLAAPRQGRLTPFLSGALIVGAAAAATAWLLVWATPAMASRGWLGVAAQIWLLKCSFSLHGLFSAARAVQRALAAGDLKRARVEVGLHLVSRPTSALGAAEVASATVESVAENLTDGFVAPVLCYLVLGLPAAWAYRVVNTADAMVGYRGGEFEYLGKAAARLDDLLNLVPARLAALALVAGAALAGDGRRALRTACRDHALTASPNAGWTIAAMAGALGVVLEKPGAYRLFGEGRPPTAADIGVSLRVVAVAAALAATVAVVIAAFSR